MFRFYLKVARTVKNGIQGNNINKTKVNEMFGPCTTNTKVGFFDLDVNIHMNNSKFLEACELGRWDFCAKNGMLKVWYNNLRNKENVGAVYPVIASCNIKFLKQIKYKEKYYIQTSITAVDDKYAYFEQKLYKHKSDKCAAIMFGKTAMLGRTKPHSSNFVVIPPKDVFQDMLNKKIFLIDSDSSSIDCIDGLAKYMPPVDKELLNWIELDRPNSVIICNNKKDNY